MPKRLILLLLLVGVFGCAKRNHGRWKFVSDSGIRYSGTYDDPRKLDSPDYHRATDNGTGLFTIYYSNGRTLHRGRLENGLREGLHEWWHPNGRPDSKGSYSAGKESGLWQWWYDNGQVKTQGRYVVGKEEGLWESWYPDGTKRYEMTFMHGVVDGPVISWFETGSKEKEGVAVSNKEQGVWNYWDKTGRLLGSRVYRDGMIVHTTEGITTGSSVP